jgi:hypothetical protein
MKHILRDYFSHLASVVMANYAEAGVNVLFSASFYFLPVSVLLARTSGSESHILSGLFIILVLGQKTGLYYNRCWVC